MGVLIDRICLGGRGEGWINIENLNYEVSSIKNANLSIKYELIKLQKFQIARKKGINVVVRFQYRKSAETKTQSVADN